MSQFSRYQGEELDDLEIPVQDPQPIFQNPQDKKVKNLLSLTTALVIVSVISLAFAGFTAVSSSSTESNLKKGTKSVLIAKQTIKTGTLISAQMLQKANIPDLYRIAGASDKSVGFVGKTALTDIPKNSQLSSSLLADSSNSSTLAHSLSLNLTAVTIAVTPESGMDSMLKNGDHVSIVGSIKSGTKQSLITLSTNAKIISVGGSVKSTSYSTVTVAVTQIEAQNIRSAQFSGPVSLILLSALQK